MKTKILIFFILAFISIECKATHLIGGELTYQCLGNNNYLLTLKIFRDCYNGIPWFDDPAYIFIYNSSDTLLQTISLVSPASTNLPIIITNPCLVAPPNVCVEEGVYTFTVNLPPLAGGYQLAYQRCCRNNSILNISDPGAIGTTNLATIPDPGITTCNSSPYFNNFPPIALCAGDSIKFDHSATDIDGDSLVYELCTPFEGADTINPKPGGPWPNPLPPPYGFVNYIPPYSTTNPLNGSPPLSIDPQTGYMTGVPWNTGQFVVGVCVSEYRNGVLLSVNKRDFQFNVVVCGVVAATPSFVLECDDYSVSFDNNSIFSTTYFWDFGDGNTSTLATPTHTYADTGVYYAMLIANPGMTCADTAYSTVEVYPGLIADFSYITTCAGSDVIFNDLSISLNGDVDSWDWDFGDGQTSTDQHPQHTYASGGNYTVILIATCDKGCIEIIVQNVFVYPLPQLNFIYSSSCIGTPITFTDLTTISSGSVISWSWNFGDGSPTDNNQNPQHTYSSSGNYNVMLITISDNGCIDTIIQLITVGQYPVAGFNILNACSNDLTQFIDVSTIAGGTIVSWNWDFGDGSPNDNSQNPFHVYSTSGIFNATLIVTSDVGCSDTVTMPVNVYPLPAPNFNYTSVCLNDLTQFSDASSVAGGNIVSWNWDFGDGSPNDNSQNPFHVYSTSGIFNATLIVTSDVGCSDTITLPVNVYPLPAPNFNNTSVCLNDLTQFSDASSVAGGNIVSWNWDFGDGTGTSVAQNPTYMYGSDGFYDVALTVTSNNGCVATLTQQIEVYPLPAVNFTNDNPCVNTPMTFTDLTTISSGSITVWLWNFNNEAVDNVQNPVYTFSDTGYYNVTLTALSEFGCVGSTQQTIYIKPLPLSDAGEDTALCPGYSVMIGTSNNPNYTYLWSPTTWLNSPAISNPVLTLNNDTSVTVSYNYIVTTTSSDGCNSYDTVAVDVYPEINANIPSQPVQCLADNNFNFSAMGIYGPGASFDWDFGDSVGTSTLENPSYTYSDTGGYTITLTITDNGCVSTAYNTVSVFEIPQAYFWLASGVGCDPFSVEFFASSLDPAIADTQLSYFWNFGDNTYSVEQSPQHVFTPHGSYAVSLTIELGSCSGFASMTANTTIIVNPTPTAAFSIDSIETSIFTPVIQFTDASFYDVISWQWDFGDGTTDIVKDPPPHTYGDTGTYAVTLYVINPYGCNDVITRTVRINPEFTFYIPNAFTPDNKDGDNDVFIGIGYKYVLEYEMRIFNRWGDEIFKTNDINKAWDGRANGGREIAQQDVYVYSIKIKDVFKKPHHLVGTVTLIR